MSFLMGSIVKVIFEHSCFSSVCLLVRAYCPCMFIYFYFYFYLFYFIVLFSLLFGSFAFVLCHYFWTFLFSVIVFLRVFALLCLFVLLTSCRGWLMMIMMYFLWMDSTAMSTALSYVISEFVCICAQSSHVHSLQDSRLEVDRQCGGSRKPWEWPFFCVFV